MSKLVSLHWMLYMMLFSDRGGWSVVVVGGMKLRGGGGGGIYCNSAMPIRTTNMYFTILISPSAVTYWI